MNPTLEQVKEWVESILGLMNWTYCGEVAIEFRTYSGHQVLITSVGAVHGRPFRMHWRSFILPVPENFEDFKTLLELSGVIDKG